MSREWGFGQQCLLGFRRMVGWISAASLPRRIVSRRLPSRKLMRAQWWISQMSRKSQWTGQKGRQNQYLESLAGSRNCSPVSTKLYTSLVLRNKNFWNSFAVQQAKSTNKKRPDLFAWFTQPLWLSTRCGWSPPGDSGLLLFLQNLAIVKKKKQKNICASFKPILL